METWYAAVAPSTFSSKDVKNSTGSGQFFTYGCQKNYMPLWREAHFQVKMLEGPMSKIAARWIDR